MTKVMQRWLIAPASRIETTALILALAWTPFITIGAIALIDWLV